MQTKKVELISFISIFFIAPQIVFAIDSTNPDIIPTPPVESQCFTINAAGTTLNLTAQPISASISLTNCVWRGGDALKVWVLGIMDAVYEQTCQGDEIAVGVQHKVQGAFTAGGQFSLYIRCCKVEVNYAMSQSWSACPS